MLNYANNFGLKNKIKKTKKNVAKQNKLCFGKSTDLILTYICAYIQIGMHKSRYVYKHFLHMVVFNVCVIFKF